MDKAQAIHNFWNSFGLKAYDENSVPDDVTFPYITYNVQTDSMDRVLNLYGSIWYRDTAWAQISQKSDEIAKALYNTSPYLLKLNKGYLWLTKGQPFAQRMGDPSDDMIRRMYLNIQAEFLTAY